MLPVRCPFIFCLKVVLILLQILYRGYTYVSGISAGKEVDIGLGGGCEKVLRPANMLLYSWDSGFDVCVDLTGSSPLTQTGMADFMSGWAVIDVAQRKRGKYMAKCAAIGYMFCLGKNILRCPLGISESFPATNKEVRKIDALLRVYSRDHGDHDWSDWMGRVDD
nr:hypothetical protein [Tanacetum cinerariifolium]